MIPDPPTQERRILVVDDSRLSRTMLSRSLRELFPSATLVEATSGSEGLDAFESVQGTDAAFNLVVVDFMMPGMTGLDMLKHIRETDDNLPIYVVTANIQDATRERAEQLGATGFIHKTMNPQSIRDALAGVA